MGMRPTFNVPREKALDPLVDKTIGNAYKTVNYVAENMDKLLSLTPREFEERFIIGSLGLLGETVTIPIPSDIPVEKIRNSVVQIRDVLSQIYTEQSGLFTVVLRTNGLHVTLKPTSPYELQNSTILWTITYGVTVDV